MSIERRAESAVHLESCCASAEKALGLEWRTRSSTHKEVARALAALLKAYSSYIWPAAEEFTCQVRPMRSLGSALQAP